MKIYNILLFVSLMILPMLVCIIMATHFSLASNAKPQVQHINTHVFYKVDADTLNWAIVK